MYNINKILEDYPIIIAGPCAVENESQIVNTAITVKKNGASILRGGTYKLRSSPKSFQGLGKEGLKLLNKAGKISKMPTVTEVVSEHNLYEAIEYVDLIQIGTRNMQNYSLLKEVGKLKVPVILKRGMASTIDEFLLAAEYIKSGGNTQIILCERGIRTFEVATRNTLDISAVPILKSFTDYKVIVDPCHAVGKREYVEALSMAALAAGADGIMIEVHPYPDKALSDGRQSVNFSQFKHICTKIEKMKDALLYINA